MPSIFQVQSLVFLDVETTGLYSAENDRICEIALMRCDPSGKTEVWETLVNPCRPLSAEAAAVNCITEEMLVGAPKFSEIAGRIIEFIKGAVLVCHNAKFDIGFLEMELGKCSISLPEIHSIDTLKIARKHFSFPSNSLGNIAASLNIEAKGAHRAMADVHTTRKIFDHFRKELDRQGISIEDTAVYWQMNS